ncbi:hypothetical protein BU14_0361s0002 [Porphyra umbilicalis]|uniref:Uncharacterized protein n=1 Tax=Porphyra umbilicalis TaxID=2786 RepID=A0A1X6NXC7_PORUM|nr:hypothetical protein BU14_0361s0002 [Porphyra umbilicalis]|eukprot:OSX73274.1 hypothetical protein BU14_0361s0002 [Porphyra umbilicalis]
MGGFRAAAAVAILALAASLAAAQSVPPPPLAALRPSPATRAARCSTTAPAPTRAARARPSAAASLAATPTRGGRRPPGAPGSVGSSTRTARWPSARAPPQPASGCRAPCRQRHATRVRQAPSGSPTLTGRCSSCALCRRACRARRRAGRRSVATCGCLGLRARGRASTASTSVG